MAKKKISQPKPMTRAEMKEATNGRGGIDIIAELQREGRSARYGEFGTTGLQIADGYIGRAHTSELTWPAVFPLFNRIRRSDPEIQIVRMGFEALASKSTLSYVPGTEKPSSVEDEATDFANEVLEDMEGGVRELLNTAITYTPFMGWTLFERVWGLRSDHWRPPDKTDPWRSEFNDNKIGIRRLGFRDHSSFKKWHADDKSGRVMGMVQSDYPNKDIIIPFKNAVHLKFGDVTSPEGLSPLEAVWRLERYKYNLELVQGIGYERVAGYLKFVADQDPTADDKAMVADSARAVQAAQSGNYLFLPAHITADMMDINFTAAPAILEAIRYYGILKLQQYLMQWVALSATSGVGSQAAMQDSSSMFMVYFNSMLTGLVQQIDGQLTKPLFDINATFFPGLEHRPKLISKPVTKWKSLEDISGFITAMDSVIKLGSEDETLFRERSEGLLSNTLGDSQEPISKPDKKEVEPAELEIPQFIGAGFVAVRAGYERVFADNIRGYFLAFEGTPITNFRNKTLVDIATHFTEAFIIGYRSSGAITIDAESLRWLKERITAEKSFARNMWSDMREIKQDAVFGDIAHEKARGYANTLDGIHLEGLMRGQPTVMLTFSGPSGEESCSTCTKWNNKRHSSKFWYTRGIIPGQVGANLECGGFHCKHYFIDDEGNRFHLV